MITNSKRLLFAIVVLLLIPVVLFVASIRIRAYHLRHADHSGILSACREAITNRGSYRNDNPHLGAYYENDVVVFEPLPDGFPQAIRALHPKSVILRKDYALINLSLPGCRICLLGFRQGATQFGTFRYIDGLWFWNGHDNTTNGKSQATRKWSNKSLQATRDGRSSSASRFTFFDPACLSSGR